MTVLTRWEPFREFSTLQDRMNRLFRESYSGVTNPPCAGQKGKELRFVHGAIEWAVHARRQVGRKHQWCILREPVQEYGPRLCAQGSGDGGLVTRYVDPV
jgi:hypothetical protein